MWSFVGNSNREGGNSNVQFSHCVGYRIAVVYGETQMSLKKFGMCTAALIVLSAVPVRAEFNLKITEMWPGQNGPI